MTDRICHACGRPIGNTPIVVDNNHLYHLECKYAQSGIRCAGCGYQILGPHIEAYNRVWHPEHFTCTRCRKPFTSPSICEQDGKLYCESCHEQLFIPRCTICSNPVNGEPKRNPWGEIYCISHLQEHPACSCCGRPVCTSLTRGGFRYGDGRIICSICRRSAVDTEKDAWHAYYQVRRFLVSQGVFPPREPIIPFERADQNRIAAVSLEQHARDGFGAIMKLVPNQGPGGVTKIYVLEGLPAERFSAAAAHELGHAWLCLKNIRTLTPETEEGFCELLGYLWLADLDTSTSNSWRQLMRENPDPVFAEGLRMALDSYRQHSLAAILTFLQTRYKFP